MHAIKLSSYIEIRDKWVEIESTREIHVSEWTRKTDAGTDMLDPLTFCR